MYFVNEEHAQNFQEVLLKWPQGLRDREYRTACYVLAVPMVFDKAKKHIPDYRYPVDWIWRYLKWREEYKDEWEVYSRRYDDDREHPDETKWRRRRPFDLTSSMEHLGKFALNMWNSYDDFNLMKCIGSLDDQNYKVLRQAITIRVGH